MRCKTSSEKTTQMRLLICGARDWTDDVPVRAVVDCFKPKIICQGEARGADLVAKSIAITEGIEYVGYKADWRKFGKGAGPVRNRRMLSQFAPEVVVAFKDGFDRTLSYGGTEDMCKIALEAGVRVWLVYHTDDGWDIELLGEEWKENST